MENGSFQTLRLSEFDFLDQNKSLLRTAQDKSENRPTQELTETAGRPIKSETVEALISQNEDLMARLKITLRKMTSLESDLHESQTELKKLRASYSATQDQLLIWKEKEKIWKDKNQDSESELELFKRRFPNLQKMEYQLERYKRYQEKVKTTIKPYLAQLKEYAKSLHQQIQDLNLELNQKEAIISGLENKVSSLKEEIEQTNQFHQMNQNALTESHEQIASDLRRELSAALDIKSALEFKLQNFEKCLERQDELENLVVALRRNKEDFQHQIQEELESLRESAKSIKLQNAELSLSQAAFKEENIQLKESLHRERSEKFQLEEQLASLRFMWKNQCEEQDKLKVSILALENLNKELSISLNKLRSKSST